MTLHLRPPVHGATDLADSKHHPALALSAPYRQALKRMLDVVLVLIVALPLGLLLMPICLMIMRDGASPFYRQQRLGRNGRVFGMWKLRSMVPDAEARLEEHLAADPVARAEWDHMQKLRNDPRITPIGHVIRKCSLDEVPQLWNVLRGEMSLVGPRPMMVEQRHIYPGTAYYAMRPGITGYWQTSVRNESSFIERATFDAAYLRDMSLRTDLAILLRTVRVVIAGTGC